MKKAVLFLVICSFLMQASIKTVILIDWKIDQIRITKLYCVNKDNPLMHCNGNCYLSKKLKKIESDYKQSKNPFSPKNVKSVELNLFVQELFHNSFEVYHFPEQSFKGGIYKKLLTYISPGSCFHPPNDFSISPLTA